MRGGLLVLNSGPQGVEADEDTTMTEREWLESGDVAPLIHHIERCGSKRKLRLFALACCRSIAHLLIDKRSRVAVTALERFADGRCDLAVLARCHLRARAACRKIERPLYQADGCLHSNAESSAACAVLCAAKPDITPTRYPNYVESTISSVSSWSLMALGSFDRSASHNPSERQASDATFSIAQVGMLRDIFGNPFRPITINPNWLAWNDSTVVKIAQVIYDEHGFDRMPMLADALEEASCDNAHITGHCRSTVLHVRGCWVIDLLLGKE